MNYSLVYGLSADPIHTAHGDLLCAAAVGLIERGYGVTRALIVPVYRRNLPKHDPPAPYEHRLAMCHIAARDAQDRLKPFSVKVEVSPIDRELAEGSERPNYTLETLAALRRSDPARGLIFLMSSDLVSGDDPELARWHRPEELVRLAVIAVALRPGYSPNERLLERLSAAGGVFVLLTALTSADISARDIRARIAAGDDPRQLADQGLLLPGVADYIRLHRLYVGPPA